MREVLKIFVLLKYSLISCGDIYAQRRARIRSVQISVLLQGTSASLSVANRSGSPERSLPLLSGPDSSEANTALLSAAVVFPIGERHGTVAVVSSAVAGWPCLASFARPPAFETHPSTWRQQFSPFYRYIYSFILRFFVMMNEVAVTTILHVFLWPYLFFALDINGGWSCEGHSPFSPLSPRHAGLQSAARGVSGALRHATPIVFSVASSCWARYQGPGCVSLIAEDAGTIPRDYWSFMYLVSIFSLF